MKIILVVHQFFPESRAGTEVLTLEMAKEFVSRGHEVLVIAGKRNNGPTGHVSTEAYEGVRVARISVAMLPVNQRMSGHITNSGVELVFRQIVKEFHPDIVHFNHVMAISVSLITIAKKEGAYVIFSATDFWAICPTTKLYREWEGAVCTDTENAAACFRCLLPKSKRLPVWLIKGYLKLGKVLPIQGSVLSLANDLQVRNKLMMDAINTADTVLVATRFMEELLVRHGASANKVKHLSFGVNIGSSQVTPKKERGGRPLRVGFIGSIVPVKGPQILLQAYEFLGPLKTQAEIRIYGDMESAGDFGDYLVALARQAGPGIEFCGTFSHDEIGSVLAELDVLTVPSIWFENTPLVLCSALASQTPVLVSDLGGMVEIVEEGINGFSFSAGSAQELAKLLENFIADQYLTPSLSESMKRRHIKNSTEYAIEVERLYLSLMR